MSNRMYFEISLWKLCKQLWKRMWLIALVTLLFAGTCVIGGHCLVNPMYEADVMLYVNNFNNKKNDVAISSSDLSAAQSLVDTYIVILKSRSTLEEVIKITSVDYSYEELKKMIHATSVDGTEVFQISVKSNDWKEAELIANTIAEVLPDNISKVVEGSSVRVVDYASTEITEVSPKTANYVIWGAIIGFFVGIILVVAMYLLDSNIHTEEDLLMVYNAPILGRVPKLDKRKAFASYYGKYGEKYGSYGHYSNK